MHTNRILLTEASDATDAVEKVESFLEHYGDDKVWDWYVIGGRWSWVTDLLKKYEDKICKPHTFFYWNEFHDKEVIGKTVLVELPDGSTKTTAYGMEVDRAIKNWIEEHPTYSEVKRGDTPDFFKLIKKQEEGRFEEFERERNYLVVDLLDKDRKDTLQAERIAKADALVKAGKREDNGYIGDIPYTLTSDDIAIAKQRLWNIMFKIDPHSEVRFGMPLHYINSIAEKFYMDSFDSDSYFFDIDDYNNILSPAKKQKIKDNPEKYFIVNVDSHN